MKKSVSQGFYRNRYIIDEIYEMIYEMIYGNRDSYLSENSNTNTNVSVNVHALFFRR
jgi:hypothetical protein